MQSLYLSEIRKELAKHSTTSREQITEKDIASLPEPLRRYFHHCGYLGKEKMLNAEITWQDAYLKIAPDKDWMAISCQQFNSIPEPSRIVYMKSNLMGVFPFEGRDKYQDGHGNMRIKLLKIIPIVDAKGKEMDASALVTLLAETLLVPTYALQPYIHWEAIDANRAKATISHNQTEVSGIFHFNDLGELVRFNTEDRYYSERGAEYKNMPWSADSSNYIEKNGIKFPTDLTAIWHTETGDYPYFKGKIKDIRLNIKDI